MTCILRKGSSKDIWSELDHDGNVFQVYFEFSDRVSIFDRGSLPREFTGLGRLRCAIAGKIFQALNRAGFLTHYISHDVPSARMYVQPVNIPALGIDYGEVASHDLMPVELLCRLALTEKFNARIKRGEVSRQAVERLMGSNAFRLDPGFVECSTKFESTDRYLTDAEAAMLIQIPLNHLHSYYNVVQDVFRFLSTYFRSAGYFLLMDGKLEASLSKDGIIMFVDSISPDELRLIGSDDRSYDKDPVRQWYETQYPEWYAELKAAKVAFPDDKSKWPDYPTAPPDWLIQDMVGRYRTVAEAIGAI